MSVIASSFFNFLVYGLSCFLLHRMIRSSGSLQLHILVPSTSMVFLIILLFSPLPLFLLDFFAILILFLSTNGKLGLKIHDYLLVLIINESVMGLWESALIPWHNTLDSYYLSVSEICVLVIYTLGILVKKYLRPQIPLIHVKKTPEIRTITVLYYIVIILSFLMLFVVALLKALLPELNGETVQNLTKMSLVFSHLAICGVAVVYVYVSSLYLHFVGVYRQEQMTNKMVQEYYKLLLEKESNTRAYRHDINNHLIGLRHLLSNGQTDKAMDYLESMQQSVPGIQEKVFVTGNSMIDAITNYFFRLLPEQSSVTIKGNLPEEVPLDDYYLNTVYSNLLQNAIEASLAVWEEGFVPVVSVDVCTTSTYIHFIIKNIYSGGNKHTYLHNATDMLLHGFGNANIRKALKRLNGVLETSTSDNTYEVTVHIPLSHT